MTISLLISQDLGWLLHAIPSILRLIIKKITAMKIEVRKAHFEDAAYIALLGRITFQETFGHLFPIQEELNAYLNDTFSVAKIQSSLMKENNVFWLALADDLPVGFAKFKSVSWFDDADREAVSQVQKIYVLKDFLKLKLGFNLYQHIENEALRLNSKSMWLVVLQSNVKAIQFYEKIGFEKIKQHFFDIGSQHFQFDLMVKKIKL
jgi:diamine N-acetyltransferase